MSFHSMAMPSVRPSINECIGGETASARHTTRANNGGFYKGKGKKR